MIKILKIMWEELRQNLYLMIGVYLEKKRNIKL